MNIIQQTVHDAWIYGRRTKKASKGWITGNAVCCIHNGETPDTRGRGGIIVEKDMISYHCFNCSFKTGWKPGWHLSYKMRKLMDWMGVDESTIKRMVFESIRVREEIGIVEEEEEFQPKIEFENVDLPERAKRIGDVLLWYSVGDDTLANVDENLMEVVAYAGDRGLSDKQIEEMYWTPDPENVLKKMNRRLIIPMSWENEVIGYTARSIDDNKVKYLNHYDSDYVYNIDGQLPDAKFAIVVEGPMDALMIGGVAILGSEISDVKADIVDRLGREIIVVPDRDKKGQQMIDLALKYGWSVSLPEWADDDVHDVADAVEKYGKVYTLKKILECKYDTRLKIELMRKNY